MWSDNESDLDLLGCSHLVRAVTTVINNESLLPATIGVFGDWGSGKSSLMKMVELDLSGSHDVLVLSFNGWLFEGYEDAKTALMGTILDELGKRQGLTKKATTLLGKLLKRINWMRALGLAAKGAFAYATGGVAALGLAAGTAAAAQAANAAAQPGGGAEKPEKHKPIVEADDVAKLLKEDSASEARRGIREFRADFEELLKEAKLKTLVVMIDDLDRCMPDTIIETLEAIKLFLFVPQTAFIIGADERLVQYAVRRRFPELPGQQAEVGRDYLEKLIQFPVRVPPLGRPEMETYINLLFAKNGELTPGQFDDIRKAAVENCSAGALLDVRFNHGIAESILGNVPAKLADNLALAQQIAPILAAGLNGNPRQCKRFLNTLVVRAEMAAARKVELERRVLAKLMLLEYFRPESFKKLAEAQADQAGKPAELVAAENAAKSRPHVQGKPAPAPAPAAPPADPRGESKRVPPRPAPKDSDADEPARPLPVWLSDDPWITDWLRLDPLLAGKDLQPYFFFSRDRLGPLGGSAQRMSPKAQEVLAELMHNSDAVRRAMLKKAGQLSNADAAAVFETLSERIGREEDLAEPSSAFMRAFDWIGARPELFGQFVTRLLALPHGTVPFAAPPKVVALIDGDDNRARIAKELLSRWAQQSANTKLKNTAEMQLKKLP